ncbi:MAG: hypothetical protein ACD_45C00217G0009 [uncultured bacterium]|nr:MAG: hypothetical protein ACD_45C00217G0009 [uncultured bacterium]
MQGGLEINMSMTRQANIVVQRGCLFVSGDLNFLTVMAVWQKSLVLFKELNELHFDLAHVHSSNSAGLALLVEWVRYAKNVNKPITFADIPPQLNSIIAAAGMQKMLSS